MELNYKDPEFYTEEHRSQFEIVEKVQINTLPTLRNVKDYYQIHLFSDGYIAVFNTERNKYRKPHIGDKKSYYFKYGLMTSDGKSKTVYMHRLVGLAWIDGWEDGKEIDHVDTNQLNNLMENLEWVTGKENTQRAVKNGLGVGRPRVLKVKKGKLTKLQKSESSSKGRNGLTYDQVETVFTLFEAGFNEIVIAEKFGVSQPCISQILKGKRWKAHPASKLYMSKLEAV